MGITTMQLGKMLEQGQVMAVELLPKLALELTKTFRPTEEMLNGPQASIARMRQAFIDLGVAIGEGGLNDALVIAANRLEEFAKSDAAKNLGKVLGKALEILANNIDSIATALGVLLAGKTITTVSNTFVDMGVALKGVSSTLSKAKMLISAVGAALSSSSLINKGISYTGAAFNTVSDIVKNFGVNLDGLVGKLKKAGLLATSFAAGFAIGDYLRDQFAEVQVFGNALVSFLLTSWERIKLGADIVWTGIKLAFSDMITGIVRFGTEGISKMLNSFAGIADKIPKADGVAETLRSAATAAEQFGIKLQNASAEKFNNEVARLKSEMAEANKRVEEIKKSFDDANQFIAEQKGLANSLGVSYADLSDALKEQAIAQERLARAEAERKARIEELNAAIDRGEGLGALARFEATAKVVDKVQAKLNPLAKELAAIQKNIDKIEDSSKTFNEDVTKMAKSSALFKKDLKELNKTLKQAKEDGNEKLYEDTAASIKTTQENIAKLDNELKTLNVTQKENAATIAELRRQQKELLKGQSAKYFEEQVDAIAKQRSEVDALIKSLRDYGTLEKAQIASKAKKNNLDDEQIKFLIEVNKQLKEQKMLADALSKSNLGQNLVEGFSDAAEGIGNSIGDALNNGDWDGLGREIGGIFSSAIGDTIGANLTASLTSSLGMLAGPIGGLVGGLADSVLNTFISEGFSGTLFGDVEDPTERRQRELGTGTVLGDDEAKSKSIINSLNLIASTNQDLVNINTGMLKSLENLSDSIKDTISGLGRVDLSGDIQAPTANIDVGNALAGAALGAPALGELATDFLDFFSFGLFSELGKALGGKVSKLDEGIEIVGGYMANLAEDTVVRAFNTFKEKKNFLDDYDEKTRYSDLGDDINAQFTQVFRDIGDAVEEGAKSLGISDQQLKDIYKNFEIDTTKISLEGLDSNQQAEALQAYFGSVFDELTAATIPWLENMQMAGEGLGETLTRVSTQLALANEAYLVLGTSLESTSEILGTTLTTGIRSGALADGITGLFKNRKSDEEILAIFAQQLVDGVGGAEAFSQALAGFESNFLSAEEQISNKARRLNDVLGEVGITLPETRDGFADLVRSADKTRESGREQLATLLKLQGAADQYYDALEAGAESTDAATEASTRAADLRAALADQEDALLKATIGEEEYRNVLRQREIDALKEISNGTPELMLIGLANALYELEDATAAAIESQRQLESIQSRISNAELNLIRATSGEEAYLAEVRARELESVRGLANEEGLIEALEELYDLEDAAKEASNAVSTLGESLNDMVNAAVDAFFKLNFQAFNLDGSALTSGQIEDASQALISGVGDISSFNSAVNNFSSNFLSAEFKFNKASSTLTNSLEDIGLSLPETREGFSSLLRSMNAMTESGQIGISTMLKVTEEAELYYSTIEAQAERITDLQIRLLKAQGKETEALSKTRQKELDAANATEQAILRQIFAAEDLASREAELLGEVADVQERLNDAYRDQISNLEDTASRMRSLNESLRDFGTDLALGDMSALSPQEQLALARSEFESTASAAQSGDINALERLQSVAQAFLEESREFQGSGGTYADDFARVQDVISTSASIADIQADQAERQAMLMERQLERQSESLEETRSIKEALLALIAVQKESGILSLSELEAMKSSLAILESNSSLSSSQL